MPRNKPATPTTDAVVPLRYVGQGAFLPGVPAKDIEVGPDEAATLCESGLYAVKVTRADIIEEEDTND